MKKLKILLPTTGLDIGGAETHVTELAKQLKEMGHQPIVMSSGGIYVEELKNYDISHVECPLNSKSPMDIIASINGFNNAVKIYQPDIIHTHGRIAALISKLVSLRFKIPFMSTSHALFTYRWPLKHLTFWGDEIIAISNDAKQHLIRHFDVDADKITVITNGINMKRFHPDADHHEIEKELALRKTSKKVVYISRLTGPLVDIANMVVDIAPKLKNHFKDIEIIIVGDGEGLNSIKQHAEGIENNKHYIKIIGKRTDIPNILNMADVVIAVGRTAIEAMAMEKSIILAGGEGYLGILTEDKFHLAQETNFTGRNIGIIESDSQLFEDVKQILELPKNDVKDRGSFFRKKVMELYSVEEMARQTVEVYHKLLRVRGDKR
ncbi:glycosyltransferase [Alkaliphilus peptidifermentans]|uniref:Glycosyltransferase involved in cell wall bisynthesis n=1 Tax=Alkaliphilus peptidifermentans DSM 18978 TaxID=1120976 RepID=A0A1G5GBT6_9FIRM|nr:glycosyltransferase [Alkaliphilus peptidifermentans]SCY48992.1 Glycosyltransferase involved in cell wall bisynthesis [Alkaliphilus peptidifermentans DSM 18978]